MLTKPKQINEPAMERLGWTTKRRDWVGTKRHVSYFNFLVRTKDRQMNGLLRWIKCDSPTMKCEKINHARTPP